MKLKKILCIWGLGLCATLLRADLNKGLLVYFPINDGAGAGLTIRDLANNATATFDEGSDSNPLPRWQPDSTVYLNHFGQSFRSDSNALGAGVDDQITISAWVIPYGYGNWIGIVTKGVEQAPYTFTLWGDGGINLGVNQYDPAEGSASANWVSSLKLNTSNTSTFQHVAVTYDGSRVRFYVNGVKDSYEPGATIVFGSVDEPLVLGADLPGGDEHLNGFLRDVAVYDRALDESEVAQIFNGEKPQPALLDTAYTGLWVGQATLSEVKETGTGTWSSAPSGFNQRVLLHVNSNGKANLLSEATIMQTRVSAPASPEQVVISDPLLIPNYDGITPRGGRMVGQRFSSATTPISETSVALSKDGETFSADLTMSAADPLNPFRHKYHPDLKNGYAIGRTLSFTVPAGDSPADNTFTGSFSETVSGLHKDAIEARGSVTFVRVSTAGTLNN